MWLTFKNFLIYLLSTYLSMEQKKSIKAEALPLLDFQHCHDAWWVSYLLKEGKEGGDLIVSNSSF